MSDSNPPRPRLGRLLFIALLLIAIGLVAGFVPRMRQKQVVLAETKELALPTVHTATAAPAAAAPTLQLSGELRASMEAPIYARATGYVRKWNADIGQQVKAGEVLAELDTPDLDRELLAARADLKQAEAGKALADSTAKRWTQLLLQKTVSPQEAEERQADASLKAAAVDAAAARVERLQDLTAFSKLTAPFAGTVTARMLDVGQLVNTSGNTALYRVAQTDKLRVFVRVPQTFAHSVKVGQKAEITVPEVAGQKFEATVVRTAGAMDAASRTLLTEMEIDNSKGELLAGSFAQVRLADVKADAVLAISSNALIFRAEGAQVAVVTPENKIALHKIQMGRDFGPTMEVLGGITAQDQVVLNPPDSLVDGVEVRVAADNAKKSAAVTAPAAGSKAAGH